MKKLWIIAVLLTLVAGSAAALPNGLGWSFPIDEVMAHPGLAPADGMDVEALAGPGICPSSLFACIQDCYCDPPHDGCGYFFIETCTQDCIDLFSSGTCPCD